MTLGTFQFQIKNEKKWPASSSSTKAKELFHRFREFRFKARLLLFQQVPDSHELVRRGSTLSNASIVNFRQSDICTSSCISAVFTASFKQHKNNSQFSTYYRQEFRTQ